MNQFKNLKLDEKIIKAIDQLGYQEPRGSTKSDTGCTTKAGCNSPI